MANKTNAMRILDRLQIDYNIYTYNKDDDKIDGISVAKKIDKELKYVYKTLVAEGNSKDIYVFVIPVSEELDLKKAARAAGEKNIHMIHAKDIQKNTGYIRGGCSPIAMKKNYNTFIDISANLIDNIVVSAGKVGLQMELAVDDLVQVSEAKVIDLV